MRRHSSTRPSWRRRLSAAAVLCIPAYLMYAPAVAGPASADGDTPKIMLVMDASGSMAGNGDDGTPKIDAAKNALNSVVDEIPTDVEVGFRVFGGTAEPGTPEACTDSQITAPLAADNHDDLKAAISSYSPKGETPISYALEQSAADLGDEGPRSIILVSDGVATCQPDPCEVASAIAASGIDVRIDVIGLGVAADAAAQQQLQCVAATAGGQYYDATTQQELGDSLNKLTERAANPFEVTGEPVTGTPTIDGAPTIGNGTWLDSVGVTGTVDASRFYRVERTIPGSTLHITASVKGKPDEALRLRSADDDSYDYSIGPSDKTGLVTSSVTLDPRLDSTDQGEKYMGDTVDIAVDREAEGDEVTNGALPLQLIVIEEPPVDGIKGLPQPQQDIPEDPVTGTYVDPTDSSEYDSKTQRAIGGRSMADAQEVTSGRLEGTMAPGEVQVYKIPLDFGQFLSIRTDFPANGQVISDAISDGDVEANLGVYDSAMRYATLAFADGNGVTSGLANDKTLKAQTSQIRYLNRTSSSESTSYIGGYYYVVLSMSASTLSDTFLVPFTMDLGIHGEPEGSPKYAQEPPQDPGAAPTDNTTTDEAAAEQESGSRAVWVTAAAIGGAACLGGAAVLLLRRRHADDGSL